MTGPRSSSPSRTPATVDAVVKEIKDAGGEATGAPCDVGKREEVLACVAKAVKTYGTVHILVNNAQGFGTEAKPATVRRCSSRCEDTDEDEWEYTLRTGPTATLWFMKAVFPHMKERLRQDHQLCLVLRPDRLRGQHLLQRRQGGHPRISRTAAREWGQSGINVNIINPALETRAFDAWKSARPEFVEALKQKIPMRRLGDPDKDAGPIAVFLAGPGSDYMTGSTFMLEGGMHTLP